MRHEPDNRFLECALAVNAEFIVTVAVPSSDAKTQSGTGMPFCKAHTRCCRRRSSSVAASCADMSTRRRRCDFGEVTTPRTRLR